MPRVRTWRFKVNLPEEEGAKKTMPIMISLSLREDLIAKADLDQNVELDQMDERNAEAMVRAAVTLGCEFQFTRMVERGRREGYVEPIRTYDEEGPVPEPPSDAAD